jgi:PAS domain S-box-containing protein
VGGPQRQPGALSVHTSVTMTSGGARARPVHRRTAVGEIALVALGQNDVDALFADVARVVGEALEVDRVSLLRPDPAGHALVCVANVGWAAGEIRPVPLRSRSQLAQVFATGLPSVVADLAADTSFPGSHHLLRLGIRSGSAVAVRTESETLGVLALHHSKTHELDADEVAFLSAVGDLLGIAAARGESERRAAETAARLARLQSLTAALAGAITEQEVVDVILRQGLAASGANTAVIGLVDRDRRLVVVRAIAGDPDERLEQWRELPLDDAYPLCDTAREGATFFCETQGERDERWPALRGLDADGRHAFAALPLVGRGAPLGGLALGFPSARAFPDEERELLTTLARQCGQALERARAHEAERRANARLSFLGDVTHALNASLDHHRLLADLGPTVVPALADWYGVSLEQESPAGVPPAEALGGESPLDGDEPVLVRNGEQLASLGLQSGMLLPLRAGERTIGVLGLGASGRDYGEDDLSLAEELAARVSVAVERARLWDERAELANASVALAHVVDGVVQVDASSVVRLWNPAAARILGVSEADAIGRPLACLVEGWETAVASREVVEGARSTVPVTIRGEERWLELSAVTHAAGTVFAFRDVTVDRALEQARRDFVLTASHELRTPLASVYGAAQTLARINLSEHGRAALLGMVVEQSERLARIVEDILVSNSLDLDAVTMDVRPATAIDLLETALRAREPSLPPGIELRIEHGDADGGTVTLSARAAAGRVRLAVADQGLGIPAEERTRIFEKFYRLDPNQTRGVGGTGLGLYICRELVRRMNGRLEVKSEPGRGSTFIVNLPAGP